MEPRLFFIGDSFVNGTGDPESLGWVGRLCAGLQRSGAQLTVYNLGVRADTTALILQRWQAEVSARLAPGNPAGFVFSFGANDVNVVDGQQRIQSQPSIDNAKAILTTAQQLGPVLMVGSPPIADDPPANRRLEALSNRFSTLCAEQNIPFVPTLAELLQNSDWMEEAIANDGAHPRSVGYEALANLVQRSPIWRNWISAMLNDRSPHS